MASTSKFPGSTSSELSEAQTTPKLGREKVLENWDGSGALITHLPSSFGGIEGKGAKARVNCGAECPFKSNLILLRFGDTIE